MRFRYVALAVTAIVATGSACHDPDYLAYTWDDRQVLCSDAIDDITAAAPWDVVDEQLALAQQHGWAVMFHAHVPDKTVTRGAIERILDGAEQHALDFMTFRELVPDAPGRGALVLAFDDDAVDAWMTVRDLLAAHNARVTFFITRYYNFSPDQVAELAQLAADGHDIEPHSVDHLRATDYVNEHGLDAYMTEQVLPSFDILTAAGYPTATAYAYPFGLHSDAIDRAVLSHVGHVRTSPGSCPN